MNIRMKVYPNSSKCNRVSKSDLSSSFHKSIELQVEQKQGSKITKDSFREFVKFKTRTESDIRGTQGKYKGLFALGILSAFMMLSGCSSEQPTQPSPVVWWPRVTRNYTEPRVRNLNNPMTLTLKVGNPAEYSLNLKLFIDREAQGMTSLVDTVFNDQSFEITVDFPVSVPDDQNIGFEIIIDFLTEAGFKRMDIYEIYNPFSLTEDTTLVLSEGTPFELPGLTEYSFTYIQDDTIPMLRVATPDSFSFDLEINVAEPYVFTPQPDVKYVLTPEDVHPALDDEPDTMFLKIQRVDDGRGVVYSIRDTFTVE